MDNLTNFLTAERILFIKNNKLFFESRFTTLYKKKILKFIYGMSTIK